jgi:hypothetical protein
MSGSTARSPQFLELTRQPSVTVEPLLSGERRKPGCLGEIAVIALDDVKFNVQFADADEADDVIEADRGATGFPTRYCRLGSPGTLGEVGLSEAGPPARLTN